MRCCGNRHELVVRQIHADGFAVDFRHKRVHVEVAEVVVAEVHFGQREAKEAARREALQVIVAEVESLQVTQFGQSIGAYLENNTRVTESSATKTKNRILKN